LEFIRHIGELQCSGCKKVEADRVIYYCASAGSQLYWFVCGSAGCSEWTRLAFGYEEIGPLERSARRRIPKVRKFDEENEVKRYGTNWY
jgi:hypothetical protein